ncbi:hypothetical protein [Arthrobacter pascens]|uniref:hypothetical protein n=1 Tax=Arthrobacter pascens TaxID=1677 RepID=UPI00196ADC69|nr:hypothetical protein [Arthrobacter pascens]MBN3498598.1 hypothetical protein [Arthrobacter pascens]
MPRRNTTKRRTRPIPAELPAAPPPSYAQMARSLVERGLRTHIILEARGADLSTIDATNNQKGN